MTSKKFLTVKELSAKINVKPKTIYAWIGKRVLPCYRLEGLFRFRESEIDEWLLRHSRQEALTNDGSI